MIRIRSDESLFIVSKETIQKYPESDLYKIVNNDSDVKNSYIHTDGKEGNVTLYIDADPDVMKTIVKIMRGGTVDINSYSDPNLLKTTSEKLKLSLFGATDVTHTDTHANTLAINTPTNDILTGGSGSIDINLNNFLSSDSATMGSDTQYKIGLMFGSGQKNQLSDELTEFSSDVARNLDASINKKSKRKLKPKLFDISDE